MERTTVLSRLAQGKPPLGKSEIGPFSVGIVEIYYTLGGREELPNIGSPFWCSGMNTLSVPLGRPGTRTGCWKAAKTILASLTCSQGEDGGRILGWSLDCKCLSRYLQVQAPIA